jgi:single-strand DNA-binding protein
MPESKNKVQLTGNLGNKPDVRVTDKGKKYTRFSLATHEFYRNAQGEGVSNTYWHNIVAWGKTAEVAEKILDKGIEVSVEGKLVSRSYTDKEGLKRYVTEVEVNQINLVNGNNGSEEKQGESEKNK